MKRTLPLCGVALAAGFLLGRYSAPVSSPPAVPAALTTDVSLSSSGPASPSSDAVHDAPPPDLATLPGSDAPVTPAPVPHAASRRVAAKKHRDDTRIAVLAQRLGLTPDQIARLQAYCETQRQQITPESEDYQEPTALVQQLRQTMPDEVVAATLTPAQQAEYGKFRSEERGREAERRAYSRFTHMLQTVTLAETQKDAVFAALMEEEEGRSATMEASPLQVTSMSTGPSGEVIAQVTDADPAENLADLPGEPDARDKRLQELRDQRIQAQLTRLAPLLNEQQLAQVRHSLESAGESPSRTLVLP